MGVAEDAGQLLKEALGEDAEFRDGQLEAIVALVEDHARVLVVQRTGWGKSVVYFIATRLLRDRGRGPTILISPLLSLMRDQVAMAERLGLRAETMDGTNTESWDEIETALEHDEIDLLLVSPERLANDRFREKTLGSIASGIGLFVVDEAHCISDWGHDFRPDYLRIQHLTRLLPAGVPLLATTATANDRVVADIEEQSGPDLEVFRGSLTRDSLHLQVIRLDDQAERLAWLSEYLSSTTGSGIVYTLTVRDAIRVSAWLEQQGIDAPAYYGSLEDDERRRLEDGLRENEVKALVATVALGMGFDKPDLAFVVHFQRPTSAIAYYQQIGRAGRRVERADVVLLTGSEDDAIAEYFIGEAFPPEELLRAVLETLDGRTSAGAKEIEGAINAKGDAIGRALKILEVEGAVVHDGPRWARTVNAWEPNTDRVEAVTAVRRGELDRMREYAATGDCLMRFLTQELDDPADSRCGRCANCTGPFLPTDPEPSRVQDAVLFLRRAYRPIRPRKLWPTGLGERRGRIAAEHQLEEGRALAVYGDAGWGTAISEGKYGDDGFGDDLVEAVAEMIENDLRPTPQPTWVTSVPSQARNVVGAFVAKPDEIMEGPVLLVDDMVDSRWSITACGVALREAGSDAVFPIALGETTTGGGA